MIVKLATKINSRSINILMDGIQWNFKEEKDWDVAKKCENITQKAVRKR